MRTFEVSRVLIARFLVGAAVATGLLFGGALLAESKRDLKNAPKKSTPGGSKGDPKTRAEMASIFSAVRVLLPLSVDEVAFADEKNRAEVEREMDRLRAHALTLSEHVVDDGPGTRFLGRTLERDAREVSRHYRARRFDQARFLLQEMTDTCIACHARLPSSVDSPLSESFVSSTMLSTLPEPSRARLLVATRRFDDALDVYERMLVDPKIPATQLMDPLVHYLTTSIRVKGDLQRPIPTLEKFQNRTDLWRALRRDTQQWIVSLGEMKRASTGKPDLKVARRLIDDASNLMAFHADRTGLIHVITASGILFRFLDEKGRTNAELGEAYYFLGVAESFIRQNYWLEEAEAYLEISIRLAPKGPWAEFALAKIEEELLMTYTGSAGQPLPEDVERRLDELRVLVDGKRTTP